MRKIIGYFLLSLATGCCLPFEPGHDSRRNCADGSQCNTTASVSAAAVTASDQGRS